MLLGASHAWAAQQAQELAGVGLWVLDLRDGGLTINGAARAMLGWADASADPQLRDFLAAVHPEDRDRVAGVAGRLVQQGESYVIEHRALLPDGRVLHLRVSACADLDGDGRPVAVHGVTLDITHLRTAALEAGRERDLSRAVVRSLAEGYLLVADGHILEVNDALCRMTGFAADELVGSGTPYPFWPPEHVGALRALRLRLKAAGGGCSEVTVQRKDGARLPAVMTATGLPSVDGTPMWILLLRDVTDEQARERRLQEQAASDPLTGVQNSRAFRDDLRTAVARATEAAPLTLALVDIDHFKAVNDCYGHAVGDEVLVEFVARLVAATAGLATVARVGGEEFALLMPQTDAPRAHRLVAAALQALRAEPFPTVGTVTASAGVSQLLDGMDDDGLYRMADALLYEAKARGRDQVR